MPLLLAPCLFISLLGVISWTFWPGLSGGFVFDDYPNLAPLEALHQLSSLEDWLAFVFSNANFPGRPLSLISFALDDSQWPWDTASLKMTNLAIHLINAVLVFILSTQVLRTVRSNTTGIALTITAIWALHPIQVSTVSYIIQRMSSLSTMFVLGGLIFYIHGRQTWPVSRRNAAWLMSTGIILFGSLAALSKENGILICLYAWIIEATILRTLDTPPALRNLRHLLLTLPLLAVAIYLVKSTQGFTVGYEHRDFNATERLLTEGRILWDYVGAIVMPSMQGGSLYHDNYAISRSLTHPPTTIIAWAMLVGAIGLAIHIRQRNEIAAFGILFFLGGHVMESTFLPLELYFEHRNYLPQLGIWILIINCIADRVPGKTTSLLALLIIGVLAFISHEQAKVWGNSNLQTTIWYNQNPESARNSYQYAKMMIDSGKMSQGLLALEKGEQKNADSLLLPLADALIKCHDKTEELPVAKLSNIAALAKFDATSINLLRTARQNLQNTVPACKNMSFASLKKILTALTTNKRFLAANGADIYAELAMIAFRTNRPDDVITYSVRAFDIRKNPTYMINAGWAAFSLGKYKLALNYLSQAQSRYSPPTSWQQPDLRIRLNELSLAITKATNKNTIQ